MAATKTALSSKPMRVLVDGVTVRINAANKLEVIEGGTEIVFAVSGALVAADSGKTVKNTGAVAEVDVTLPPATSDMFFPIILTAAQTFKFIPAGADKIFWSGAVPAGATHIYSSTIYDSLLLKRAASGVWVVFSSIGDWSIG